MTETAEPALPADVTRAPDGTWLVPLFPAPHLRAAALTATEAMVLWQTNARSSNMVRSAGDHAAWEHYERRAHFFMEVATSLDPNLEALMRSPPHYGPGGEA